ncbi:MAG: phosphoenolpyruvate synthase, partial [Bacteroidetes bacterium]|nr:phosphoenolpyruvate synthase [Bacteroidota bacterium]
MSRSPSKAQQYTRSLDTLTNDDVGLVGGKNASLGEMIKNLQAQGVRVPGGFATTSDAYWAFIEANELETPIREELARWDNDEQSLADAGEAIRELIRGGDFPDEIAADIREAYADLSREYDADEVDVAVRSSATAEDLPEASFAGQQETYLNIRGAADVLKACRKCYASLFTDRAISYRANHGFDHLEVALSAGVQKMVRADKAGVMFTIDTETGFPDVAVIDAGWGLGEPVVKGSITPDRYMVYKPLLEGEGLTPVIGKQRGTQQEKMVFTEDAEAPTRTVPTTDEEQAAFVLTADETLQLARWGVLIEAHYDRPMDIEWARDGESKELFILQARPETVQSRAGKSTITSHHLQASGERLVTGVSIGQSIATGHTSVIKSVDDIDTFEEGRVLVTSMTDPDWGPIMKKASGIVTDH